MSGPALPSGSGDRPTTEPAEPAGQRTEAQRTGPQGSWVREVVRGLSAEPPTAAQEPPPRRDAPRRATGQSSIGRKAVADYTASAGPGVPEVAERTPSRPLPAGPAAVGPGDFDPRTLTGRTRHGASWLRRSAAWVRGSVASARTHQSVAELTEAVRRPVTTGRRIAVRGARGGVGATTVAYAVAEVFASRRDDSVLVADADPLPGGLTWRSGLSEDPRVGVAGRGTRAPTDLDGVTSFLPQTSSGLWLLPGGPDRRARVDLALRLGRFFAVAVTDLGSVGPTGAGPSGDVRPHAGVLVVKATVDGVREALGVLARTETAEPVVVALVSHTPRTEGLRLASACRLLGSGGRDVVVVPYDRHLAVGGPVVLGRLAEPTVTALTRLAGQVLDLARGTPAEPFHGTGR